MRTRHESIQILGRDARRSTPSPFGVTDPFSGLSRWAAPRFPLVVRNERVRRIDPSEGIAEALRQGRPGPSGLPGTGEVLREIGRGYTRNLNDQNLIIHNLNIASVRQESR